MPFRELNFQIQKILPFFFKINFENRLFQGVNFFIKSFQTISNLKLNRQINFIKSGNKIAHFKKMGISRLLMTIKEFFIVFKMVLREKINSI
jgi:hypothetical protein